MKNTTTTKILLAAAMMLLLGACAKNDPEPEPRSGLRLDSLSCANLVSGTIPGMLRFKYDRRNRLTEMEVPGFKSRSLYTYEYHENGIIDRFWTERTFSDFFPDKEESIKWHVTRMIRDKQGLITTIIMPGSYGDLENCDGKINVEYQDGLISGIRLDAAYGKSMHTTFNWQDGNYNMGIDGTNYNVFEYAPESNVCPLLLPFLMLCETDPQTSLFDLFAQGKGTAPAHYPSKIDLFGRNIYYVMKSPSGSPGHGFFHYTYWWNEAKNALTIEVNRTDDKNNAMSYGSMIAYFSPWR